MATESRNTRGRGTVARVAFAIADRSGNTCARNCLMAAEIETPLARRALPRRPMTMRAATLLGPRRFELEEVPRPEPRPGQLLVRLEGCGVCASNIPPWEGKPWFNYPMRPGALGHEGWGTVEAISDGVSDF